MTTVAVRSAYYRATTAKLKRVAMATIHEHWIPSLTNCWKFWASVDLWKKKEWIRNNILFLRYYDMHVVCCCSLAI